MCTSRQDEIQLIKSQIPTLEEHIHIHKRLTLLSRLNTLQSTACEIPSEILTQIFEALIAISPESELALLKVGAVCQYWRSAAWRSPRLWTTITLRSSRRKAANFTQRNCDGLMKAFCENVGPLMLNVKLSDMHLPYSNYTKDIVEDTWNVIFSRVNVEKLRSLDIRELDTFDTCNGFHVMSSGESASFPVLEKVLLGGTPVWSDFFYRNDFAKDELFFNNAPRLRELDLDCFNIAITSLLPKFPWEQLTTLRLTGAKPHNVFEILPSCPCLVSFHSSKPMIPSIPPNFSIPVLIVLPALEKFGWETDTSKIPWKITLVYNRWVNLLVFSHLSLPSLRNLTWGGSLDSIALVPGMPFVKAPRRPLAQLTIPKSIDNIHSILSVYQSVTELDFTMTKTYLSFEDLDYLVVSTSRSQDVLPRLRVLRLRFSYDKPKAHPLHNICSKTTLLLYSRRYGPIHLDSDSAEEFELGVYDVNSPHWQKFSRLEEFYLESRHHLMWSDSGHAAVLQAALVGSRSYGFKDQTYPAESELLPWYHYQIIWNPTPS
ncbi:hypothetical protein NP233_g4703 [Leucocoprinus birnbaumii]|uniref:F-box domain-containing protein n=1 Tax=Leucocoprinus birnbaumii TaxID=56174 RepID=A0AAD5W0M2_9AGAR|nr:hypothetical protein NP233_g4703 [Leucocoprinus birnbaumii]